MEITSILKICALLLFVQSVLGGVCPAADHILPCTCTTTTIDCTTEQEFDLSNVFQALSKGKEPGSHELAFETFILSNSKITKIENNVFKGLIFETIKIVDCPQLSCISPLAFQDLGKNLTTFIASGTSFKSQDEDCNVFKALKFLYNLETIKITKSQIIEIPAKVFKDAKMDALKTFDLSGGRGGNITTIGQMAFAGLKNVQYMDLSYHKINKLDSFAFAFVDPSPHKLVIDLSHNNLTKDSFSPETFEVNDRVTQLKLKAQPKLQVLSETVFHPFLLNRLNATDDNTIDLAGSPIACSHSNVWLLNMESALRLTDKLKNILSPDGEVFWRNTRSECEKGTF